MSLTTITLDEVINDASFRKLVRELYYDTFTWDSFLSNSLPSSLSPLDTWRVLNVLSECSGIQVIPDINGQPLWYRPTVELIKTCQMIERRIMIDSSIYRCVLSENDQSIPIDYQIEEACAAVSFAGFSVDREQFDLYYRTNTVSSDSVERLIVNMIDIDSRLEQYQDRPFSASLLIELRNMLCRDISEDKLFKLSLPRQESPIDESMWEKLQSQLDHVIAYANDVEGATEDCFLLRGGLVGDFIIYNQLFGHLSAPIASLATRLYYLKHGKRALRVVPLMPKKLSWHRNESFSQEPPFTASEYKNTIDRSLGDITYHQILSLFLINESLDQIEIGIQIGDEKDNLMREILSLEPGLNHRQRSILARALRNPKASFRISYHQRKHKVAYATARRDLVELSKQGYLRMERIGKEFVYLADKRLEEFAMRL